MKHADYIEVILKIVILLGMLLIVYWSTQLLFGGSPTLSQFNAGFIFVLTGLIVHLYYRLGMFDNFVSMTFPRFERNVEKSFENIKKDIGLVKEKLGINNI